MAFAQIIIGIKLFTLIIALIFTSYSFLKTRQRSLKTDTFIMGFFGFYFFFITMNLINVYFVNWQLGGVGISLLFMTAANLMFCLYALEIYYHGDYRKSKYIHWLLIAYIIIGVLFSVEIGVIVFVFHDYEISGITTPMGTLVGISIGILLLYLTVFALFLGQILHHWKVLSQFTDEELSPAEKRAYRIKTRYFAFALVLLILMSIFLFFDMMYSERTLLSLAGWFCLIVAMGSIFRGYWLESLQGKKPKTGNK
jgi:hypothetical protein